MKSFFDIFAYIYLQNVPNCSVLRLELVSVTWEKDT